MPDLDPDLAHVVGQLRAARRAQGIPAEELTFRVGLPEKLVTKWETGLRRPSGWLMAIWAKALGYRLCIEPDPTIAPGLLARRTATSQRTGLPDLSTPRPTPAAGAAPRPPAPASGEAA